MIIVQVDDREYVGKEVPGGNWVRNSGGGWYRTNKAEPTFFYSTSLLRKKE